MSEHTDEYVCAECGMRFGEYAAADLVQRSASFAPRWRELVADADDPTLRSRPEPDVWSPIEYGGHLRDTLGWMAEALRRTREEDHPSIDWYGHERRVGEANDVERPLDEVTEALERNAASFTAELGRTDDWSRMADYPWGTRDALDMGRNGVHEGVHHLEDVKRVLGRLGP